MPQATSTFKQAKWWMLTIPVHEFTPYLPAQLVYIKGQIEIGETTGFKHWQLLACFKNKQRLRGVTTLFGQFHAEPTRSESANEYVWKENSRLEGTQFELGKCPFRKSESKDWDTIRNDAISGRLDLIPSDVFVRNYNSLRRIALDYSEPIPVERKVYVYWGPTGSGKSRRAWEAAGMDAYPKDPNTKFWDGYRGHKNVVMDEFRGRIDISHLLRWFDRYPVLVEQKGSGCVLLAETIYITSNLKPEQWYPEADSATFNALLRRLVIEHIDYE